MRIRFCIIKGDVRGRRVWKGDLGDEGKVLVSFIKEVICV